MNNKTETIYIYLLNEGTDCWRPVTAIQIKDNIYKITGIRNDDEEWEFITGDIVECAFKCFSDNTKALVAIRKVI